MAARSPQDLLKAEVEAYKLLRGEIQKSHASRQQVTLQEQENQMVIKELGLIAEDAKVYKLVGPTLIRQDLVEATSNVSKRLEFLGREISRLDALIKGQEEKAGQAQDRCMKLESEIRRRQDAGMG